MAYEDFLEEFARLEGFADARSLLAKHEGRYAFQVDSRNRARQMIEDFERKLGYDFNGKKVLDVGCAYGSFAIELAKKGARAIGVDVSDKWLMLADLNAYREVEVPFLHLDASAREAHERLSPHGPFDFIILNDVLEHIYDTDGLLHNLSRLLAEDGLIYYKVPNGLHPRNVLREGHRKVFGLSLLPPDYWHWFTEAPFHIYYRRWGHYRALLDHHGLHGHVSWDENHDRDIEQTRRHILNDLEKIKDMLQVSNFASPEHFSVLRRACEYYFREVERDLGNMGWKELHHKYRITFWKGVISRG